MVKFFMAVAVLPSYSFAQNVGIGISNPVEKLHVSGNVAADTIKPLAIKFPPNAGSGKILTSDANGNASWQTNTALSTSGNVGYGVWGDCATNGNISEYQPTGDSDGDLGDRFGVAVSVSGNYAIIGASFDDIGANSKQGSASIYQWNGSAWVFMQKLFDATGAADDLFGVSVAISENFAIVGAVNNNVGANADQGSASVYQRNGSSWTFLQKLTDPGGAPTDLFGISVAISGNYAIVGAHLDDVGANVNQGSAILFQWNGTAWVFMQKVSQAGGAGGDLFGYAVSISDNYAVVGAVSDDIASNGNQGSITVYQRTGGSWTLMQTITDATGLNDDNFGCSVSVSGDNIAVGALNDDIGANGGQGSVSIYQWNGISWALVQKITDPTGMANDGFGYSVSLSGNYLLISSASDDIIVTDQGSAAVYQRIGISWQRLQFFSDPASTGPDYFGVNVSLDGLSKRFIVGAFGFNNETGKAVFGKIN